jgi:hypothetical protein
MQRLCSFWRLDLISRTLCRVVPNREATLVTRLTLNSANAHTTYATCSFGGGRLPIDRECRVIWHFVVEIEATKPAVGEMELDLLAQPPRARLCQ